MKYFTGLDVSKEHTSICIVNDQGKVIAQMVAKTTVEDIHRQLTRQKLDYQLIAMETGGFSNFLMKGLKNKGWPVTCICARRMGKVINTMKKTDKNDAREIAQAVRVGYFTEVHMKSDGSVETNNLLTTRHLLVKSRVSICNSIRGQLRQYGLKLSQGSKDGFEEKVSEVVEALPKEVQIAVGCSLKVYKAICDEITVLDEKLQEIAKGDEDIAILTSIDGVGPITALAFKTAIDTPERFKYIKDVGAYIGLTATLYESGETSIKGRVSKTGPSYLRSLLVEAAVSMLTSVRKKSKLKSWGHKVCTRRGDKIGRVALARKMSVVMLSMLKTKTKFDRDHGSSIPAKTKVATQVA